MNGFRHQALLYEGEDGFLDGTLPFVRDGIDAGEPVFVVVAAAKLQALQERLGPTPPTVRFADMSEVGRNPACIIPAWREFVDAYRGTDRRLRGIGEPIGPERNAAELVECHRHEA